LYSEKSPGRAKECVYAKFANLGDLTPKKANFGVLLKNVLGIF
jgi:hypothetical protein